MLSRTLLAVALGATLSFTAGCQSKEDVRSEIVYDVQVGAYDQAIPKINDLYDSVLAGELDEADAKKPAEADDIEEKNELLWRMERGALELQREQPAKALGFLDRASDLVIERRTESLTRAVGTFVANDTASEYAGNGYEHVAVDYLRSLAKAVEAQRLQGIMEQAGEGDLDMAVQAMNAYARGMTLEKITFNQDNAPELRYFDDPWARVYAAALYLATPPKLRTNDDEGFAFAMLTKALKSYQAQQKVLGGAAAFRYEVNGIPASALRLAQVIGSAYDKDGLQELLEQVGVRADDSALGKPLAKDEGLILVLNHADWITPTDALNIDLKINVPWVPTVTEAEKARGVTFTGFMTYGGTTFYAKGPNSELAKDWGGAVAIAGELARIFEVANPGTWIGFELPWHRADVPIARPGAVTVGGTAAPLEVVADVDAFARATLKDTAPKVLAKTMGRVFAKHVAAIVAEKALEAAAEAESDQNQKMMMMISAKLSGTLSHAVASASEDADTRYWALLHDRVEASLVTVKAGTHTVSVSTANGTVQAGTVKVPAGRLVIVPVRTFPNPVANPYPAGKDSAPVTSSTPAPTAAAEAAPEPKASPEPGVSAEPGLSPEPKASPDPSAK
jgi:hypothetical protein